MILFINRNVPGVPEHVKHADIAPETSCKGEIRHHLMLRILRSSARVDGPGAGEARGTDHEAENGERKGR